MMSKIEAKLEKAGLTLPEPLQIPAGMKLRFSWIRVRSNHVYISGHVPVNPDGSIADPRGKVGAEVSVDQGYEAARLAALSVLGNLKRAVGDLDRVTAWLRVFGMVNVAPNFSQTPSVVNGFSDLILDLYGSECGNHARSAIGVAALPFDVSVEIEAEVEIAG